MGPDGIINSEKWGWPKREPWGTGLSLKNKGQRIYKRDGIKASDPKLRKLCQGAPKRKDFQERRTNCTNSYIYVQWAMHTFPYFIPSKIVIKMLNNKWLTINRAPNLSIFSSISFQSVNQYHLGHNYGNFRITITNLHCFLCPQRWSQEFAKFPEKF